MVNAGFALQIVQLKSHVLRIISNVLTAHVSLTFLFAHKSKFQLALETKFNAVISLANHLYPNAPLKLLVQLEN